MTYDQWKTRSPDDDLGDEHDRLTPEQERADWEDEMLQLHGPADPRGPFFSTAWEREDYLRRLRGEPERGPSVSRPNGGTDA